MANPRGTPETLGVTPLAEGEQSRTVRVRAPSWVFEQLQGRTALQIGELLVTVLRASAMDGSIHTLPPAVQPAPAAKPKSGRRKGKELTRDEQHLLAALQQPGAWAEEGGRGENWEVKRQGFGRTETIYHMAYKRELNRLVKLGLAVQEGHRFRAVPQPEA